MIDIVEEKNKTGVTDPLEHRTLVPQNDVIEKQKEIMREKARKMKESGKKIEPLIITKSGEVKKASELSLLEQEDEFLKCAVDSTYFIEVYLTIFDQTVNDGDGDIVPFLLFKFQKRLIQTYQNNRFIVANKYRQAGISTSTCGYIAWYIMFNKNRSVAIVADKLDTARDELMNDVIEFIEGCPDWLKPKTGKIDGKKSLKDTQKLKRYDNGSQISAFSSKGLRGYTPTLLFWDETAWTEKADKFWTSALPTLQTGGSAILVSTPNGLDPVFYKTFETARKNIENTKIKHKFVAVELWWFNDPRYNKDLKWIKNKDKENELIIADTDFSDEYRIKLMDDGWAATSPWYETQVLNANNDMKRISQEILCSFLGSGDNFIAEEYLKNIEENTACDPIRKEYSDNNMWIFEEPEANETYLIPVDVSSGHGDDNSSINILKEKTYYVDKKIIKNGKEKLIKQKKTKYIQVAEYYGKLTPQQLGRITYQYGKRYNNGKVIVDVTGGYGAQTIDTLIELGYDNLYYSEIAHKPTRERLDGYVKTGNKTQIDGSVVKVDLLPGFYIGNNRGSVLLEMQRAISMDDVIIKSYRLLSELKTFVTVQGSRVADHKRSFHDDSIISLAIGLFVGAFGIENKTVNVETTKKMLSAIITSSSEDFQKKIIENKLQNKIENRKPINTIAQQYKTYGWLFKK